jgi:DNA-binding CsgD family transcriptional regulator/PAS domain-containing protein
MSQGTVNTQATPAVRGVGDAERLEAAVALTTAATMPLLLLNLASRRVMSVSDELVDLIGRSREDIVGAGVSSLLAGRPNPAATLLATGSIEGYEAKQTIRGPDHSRLSVHLWAHAFDDARPPRTALLVMTESDTTPWTASQWSPKHVTVLGSVDADWRIQRMSAEVSDLLGASADGFVGQSFVGLIHPSDLGDALTALGHAHRTGGSVALRARLRRADGEWQWCRAYAASLDESAGFAFLLTPLTAAAGDVDVTRQVSERLATIAHEVREAMRLHEVADLPTADAVPALSALSAREWQILAGLRGGKRSGDIAESLNLAPSTVRNHLTAIYRKMGVRSQVGLLAAVNQVFSNGQAAGG